MNSKHHHPHNRRERLQLERERSSRLEADRKKKKIVKTKDSHHGRHTAELLEEKEAEDDVWDEVR